MANYKLRNGYSVRTAPAPEGRREFITSNPEGEVISSVFVNGDDAAGMERDLRVACALRQL
ncbi:hypothetical protein ACFXMT_14130 [Streptomyces mirabilis]|uniref:hypothetical protein n=1 Tax=Streptomyces mirabilis TaxID=68239 RepID=UPI00367D1A18